MARWSGPPPKPRAKSTKPRKKRVETKKRKPYVKKVVNIPKKGDIKGLAEARKKCSKKKLSDRLMILPLPDLQRYAEACKMSLRQAQRDRGPKLHKGCLPKEQEEFVGKTWISMIDYYTRPVRTTKERRALQAKVKAMTLKEKVAHEAAEKATKMFYDEGYKKCTHAALSAQVDMLAGLTLGKSQAARIANKAQTAANKKKPVAPHTRGASNDPTLLARNNNNV